MAYSYPSNMTGLQGIITHANNVTNGILMPLFMLGGLVVMYTILRSKYVRTSDALAISCLLTFILSVLLWGANIIASQYVILFLVGLTITSIYSFLDSS